MTSAETVGRPGELHAPQRVLLLSESAGLRAVLGHLLHGGDRLRQLGSPRQLAGTRELEAAAAVVLDVPRRDRAAAVEQVRRRYRGPLVVLVASGDDGGELPLDDACTLLARPFSSSELAAALNLGAGECDQAAPPLRAWFPRQLIPVPLPEPAAATAAAVMARIARRPGSPAGFEAAAARPTPSRLAAAAAPLGQPDLAKRARRLLDAFVESWRERRRVRVAGILVVALIGFTAAFVLAALGRCGPGCSPLETGFVPAPTIAVAPNESRAPATGGTRNTPGTAVAPAAPADHSGYAGVTAAPGTDGDRGTSTAGAVTTTSERQATPTTRRPGSGGGGPAPTPVPTQPPPTPTTVPEPTPTEPPTTPPPPTTQETVPPPAE